MKNLLFTIALLISFNFYSQVINEPANWPNANWTTSGTYNEAGLLADPTSADSFTFDDDAAGSTSDDDVASESPIIDLTAAFDAGDDLILISGDYSHRDIGGSLSVDYWDYDAEVWVAMLELESTGDTADYQNCSNQVYFESVLDIADFSTTQLANFKYRISYDDSDGWLWGWCVKNVSLRSGNSLSDFDNEFINSIKLYPNPVIDKLFIQGLSNPTKISVYNILGKLVFSKTTSSEINVSNLQNGIYILKIVDEQKNIVRKFIKN